MELTLNHIKAYAALNNLPIEEVFPQSYRSSGLFTDGNINEWFAKTDYTYFIGIEFMPDVWYWWKGVPNRAGEIGYIFFHERYNRRNGASQKSWRKGYEAMKKILGMPIV
jgi:hypothetical protein